MPDHSILRKKITLLFSSLLIITIYHFSGSTKNTDTMIEKDITYNIPILGSVEFGDPNASIVIIKWTDFQ